MFLVRAWTEFSVLHVQRRRKSAVLHSTFYKIAYFNILHLHYYVYLYSIRVILDQISLHLHYITLIWGACNIITLLTCPILMATLFCYTLPAFVLTLHLKYIRHFFDTYKVHGRSST
jgi:hypothetical protein